MRSEILELAAKLVGPYPRPDQELVDRRMRESGTKTLPVIQELLLEGLLTPWGACDLLRPVAQPSAERLVEWALSDEQLLSEAGCHALRDVYLPPTGAFEKLMVTLARRSDAVSTESLKSALQSWSQAETGALVRALADPDAAVVSAAWEVAGNGWLRFALNQDLIEGLLRAGAPKQRVLAARALHSIPSAYENFQGVISQYVKDPNELVRYSTRDALWRWDPKKYREYRPKRRQPEPRTYLKISKAEFRKACETFTAYVARRRERGEKIKVIKKPYMTKSSYPRAEILADSVSVRVRFSGRRWLNSAM